MSDERVDPVTAVAALCGRSGAREFEIGWLNDEGTVEFALHGPRWWASARYRGARIFIEQQATPAHACDGLAHRILDGGTCTHCGKQTTTAQTPTGTFVHARRADPDESCEWFREGDRWKRGCE
jgi:hypothetical protein